MTEPIEPLSTSLPGASGSCPHAVTLLPPRQRAGVIGLVALAGFLLAAAFLSQYYAGVFHSDSAAHQVLAQAMLDELSVLPKDFAYGNQLILWRNNLLIAPVLAMGMEGYRAYGVGSSLNFALFFVLAFLCIDSLLRDWRRSLLVCGLWFLPLGHTEADFILGQQSHLSFVVLSLVIAMCAHRAADGTDRKAIWLGAAAIFLLVVEAPTRAAMMLLPVALAVVGTGRARLTRQFGAIAFAAAACAYALSKYLGGSRSVYGVEPVPLAPYGHFVTRMNEQLEGFVQYFIGYFQFAGLTSKVGYLLLYGLKAIPLFAFAGLLAWIAVKLKQRLLQEAGAERPVAPLEFVGVVGFVGAALGFWMVAGIEYGLDVRHFLWALMLLKLVLVIVAVRFVAPSGATQWPVLAAACVAALLMSTAFVRTALPTFRKQLKADYLSHVRLPYAPRIAAILQEQGIHRIYGEYWETMRMQVLARQSQPAALHLEGSNIRFFSFLARSSLKCASGNVLYLLDPTTPTQGPIATKLLANGGRLLERVNGNLGVYIGPPVWDMAGCP